MNGLNPAFSPNVTAYAITVANSVASVTISATANHASATVNGTGTKSLNIGTNLFNVVVAAQDGTQKTYTITVTRDTDTAIESVAPANVQAYFRNHTLYICSPVAETVEVYSFSGRRIFSAKKEAGEVAFTVPTGDKAVIVRGSSGWTRKTISN
ncbi:hypothetical protein FACS189435_0370 [Bacteroidia bacterium]|nr:hypothetical protein FACS189435_0370 [Bacteroidia bacterium]